MRQRRMTVQDDLFAPAGPVIPVSMEKRETLISLIGALIMEVMTNPEPASQGGHHEPHHD